MKGYKVFNPDWDSQKEIIKNIPNYDKEIFENITHIKTE